jgi:hypothetical protein
MDVLASDSESFRMRDFDLEDSLSVSRSDDTRFTDDANTSEPDHLIQRMDLNYYEDGTLTRAEDGSERNIFPVKNASVEEWAELSRARNSGSGGGDARRDSDASAHSSTTRHDSILKKPAAALAVDSSLISLVESSAADETDGVGGGGAGSLDSFPLGPIDNISNFSTARLSTTSIASSASSHCSAASVDVLLQQQAKAVTSLAGAGGGVIANGFVPESEARPVLPAASAASTGAIPKSISFDKTADKDEDGEHKQLLLSKRDRNFFKNWKLPKIGRSRGGGRGVKGDDHSRSADRLLIHDAFHIPEHSEGPVYRRPISEDTHPTETTDDILAKYRKPRTEQHQARAQTAKLVEDEVDQGGEASNQDSENPEKSFIFQNAKRKLRLMLSEVSFGFARILVAIFIGLQPKIYCFIVSSFVEAFNDFIQSNPWDQDHRSETLPGSVH